MLFHNEKYLRLKIALQKTVLPHLNYFQVAQIELLTVLYTRRSDCLKATLANIFIMDS